MPKISVIVPIYKVEKYLKDCIDSILTQTFTDFELILVDDGSPDNCPQICDDYACQDKRIKVIHKKNGGVSAARNTALDVASGEFVVFVDGDDFILSDWLMKLVQAQEFYNADSVLGTYARVKEDGSVILHKEYSGENKEYNLSTKQAKQEYFFKNIFGEDFHGWGIWVRLFSRSIIEQHHIRFPTTCENFAEDLCFTLIYVLYSKKLLKMESEPGYCYRTHETSMMARSTNVVKLDSVNEVSLVFGERYLEVMPEYKKEFHALHFLIMKNQYVVLVDQKKIKEFKECSKRITKIDWFKKHNKRLSDLYKILAFYYGQPFAVYWTCISFLIKRRNWCLYKIALWFGMHIWIDKRHLPQRLWRKIIGNRSKTSTKKSG